MSPHLTHCSKASSLLRLYPLHCFCCEVNDVSLSPFFAIVFFDPLPPQCRKPCSCRVPSSYSSYGRVSRGRIPITVRLTCLHGCIHQTNPCDLCLSLSCSTLGVLLFVSETTRLRSSSGHRVGSRARVVIREK
jgi:hypothetical protein